MYSIIDRSGKQVEKLPDMVHVGFYEGDKVVESDYVDMKALVDALHITENGFEGLTFGSTPAEVVKYYIQQDCCWRGDKEHKAGDPYWYTYVKNLYMWKNINGVLPDMEVNFSGYISQRNYRTKRVIDYAIGDYYWYHDDKIPTGYSFNNYSINSFCVKFDNSRKLRNKLRFVFNELSTRFKNMGTVEKENNGAVVITLKNNMRALVAFEKKNVFVIWGKIAAVNEIDIEKYKDAHEESQRIKDYDYFDNKLSGIEEVDTVEADTAAVE